jgi:hypothetical protein
VPFGFAGVVGAHVDGLERAAGAGDELLDLQLGLGEELGAALVECNAALVERNRALERLAAGLELRDGLLERRKGVVERQGLDRGIGRRAVRAVSWVGHRAPLRSILGGRARGTFAVR